MEQELLIGLPATGKTTFLAALWHVVESGEVPGALRLTHLEGDREYINGLTDKWRRCEELPRTPLGTQAVVAMRLSDPDSNKEVEVLFPDLSGESSKMQWVDRFWSPEYDAWVGNSSGVLLFVHPDRIVEPHRIDEANALVAIAGDVPGRSGASEQSAFVSWSAEMAPTQVVLTDLLQFVANRRGLGRSTKLAIVISAWDLAEVDGRTPSDWIAWRLPLLAQFLASNREIWALKIFGVSAQGGDLGKDRSELLGHDHASERVRIVGSTTSEHDLTSPIKWLIG